MSLGCLKRHLTIAKVPYIWERMQCFMLAQSILMWIPLHQRGARGWPNHFDQGQYFTESHRCSHKVSTRGTTSAMYTDGGSLLVPLSGRLLAMNAQKSLLFCTFWPFDVSKHIFPIYCLGPIWELIGIYIIFITFGHWPRVNMPKWPKSHLSIRIGSKSLITR